MLEEHSSLLHKLEAYTMLNIPEKIISEVVDAIKIAEKLGIKEDWIDRILREINKRKKHFELML